MFARGVSNVFAVEGGLTSHSAALALGLVLFVQPLGIGQNAKSPTAQAPAVDLNPADAATLKHALSAYDHANPLEAEPLLRDIVGRYPKNFEATETLGLIYVESGNFSAGIPLLERACRLRSSSALAYANLGAADLKLSHNEDAARALKRSVALSPKNAQSQSALGQALMATSHPAEAAKSFSVAAAGEPGNPDILYNWALALFDAGDSQQANEVLGQVPGKESSPQVQSLFGDIEEKQGHFEAAVQHFTTAASLDPSETNVYALGLEFARHWTFDAAIKVYEFGVSKYPASARLQLGLGVAKYGNNDYAAAAPIFSQLLSADPDSALYADLLGRSCSLIAEQHNAGCDKLQAFAQHHPRNATAATFAAASILKRPNDEQDLPQAQKLLHQAMEADPNLAEAYLQMAVFDQQEMRWQASVAALEKAIALDPESSAAHYRLARAYSHLGRREEAQQEIERQQRYAQQEKDRLNARLKKVTTFLVTLQ
jgi:tetratricopeptide (TPR) repeat protein